jgi:hypothetical protein
MARALVLVPFVVATLVLASPVQAAAPNYILVSGPSLARPVLLANWAENGALLSALANAPRARRDTVRNLARRPRFDLAEFWGWSGRPRPTQPSQTHQHDWFYPAHRSQPPLSKVMTNGVEVLRLVPAQALKIFARHGIPTRL